MQSRREEVTNEYSTARAWAEEYLGRPNVATVWIPEKDFVDAHRTATSFSLSRAIHNSPASDSLNLPGTTGRYGLGFGEDIWIDPAWTEFSLPRSIPKELTQNFTLDGQWDAYFISPDEFIARGGISVDDKNQFHVISDDRMGAQNLGEGGITEFLRAHAPSSSTYPGSDEVLSWVTLRDSASGESANGAEGANQSAEESGDLVGVAAITEWESGGKLLSSVAVHSERRAQGIGVQLMNAAILQAHALGIEYLLLAVSRSNESAIRLYEKVGFTLMGQFNHFSRSQS